jgi:rubredoxin
MRIMEKYECLNCNYIYDPEKGDQNGEIEPETPFEDLPEDWRCPVCGASIKEFEEIDKIDDREIIVIFD